MLHLIAILSFSTIISVIAYMIQHGEIENGRNFIHTENQTTVIDQQAILTTASVNYLRTN